MQLLLGMASFVLANIFELLGKHGNKDKLISLGCCYYIFVPENQIAFEEGCYSWCNLLGLPREESCKYNEVSVKHI